MRLDRRRLLAVGGGILGVTVAGCTDGDSPDSSEPDADGTATETPTHSAESSTPTDDGDGELDLREANVVGVEAEQNDGEVRFSVTLIHDDDGEDGYANWWRVETLDGERVGRRDLEHAHGTREFTRSDTFEVPDDLACVVVRGHDQTHGYGGQAMLFDLDSGATRAVRQGSEPVEFNVGDCP
ncbi:hypothetical protein [Natronomonas amylolytica]|uniref:hypothetical protein n=1 Tax=Natronomonas amylolytica TaxID=3108498 RepID=UPI00300A6286